MEILEHTFAFHDFSESDVSDDDGKSTPQVEQMPKSRSVPHGLHLRGKLSVDVHGSHGKSLHRQFLSEIVTPDTVKERHVSTLLLTVRATQNFQPCLKAEGCVGELESSG